MFFVLLFSYDEYNEGADCITTPQRLVMMKENITTPEQLKKMKEDSNKKKGITIINHMTKEAEKLLSSDPGLPVSAAGVDSGSNGGVFSSILKNISNLSKLVGIASPLGIKTTFYSPEISKVKY
jgi:hypothetical protein